VFVASIEAGSLTEKFLIRYVFRGEENYENAKEVVAKVLEDNAAVKTVVALGIGAVLGYGAHLAGGSSTPNITAYNNNIVNIGAAVPISGKEISEILEAMPDKKQLAKDAVGVIRPAKADPDATIEIEGMSQLRIDPQFVREVPDEYSPPEPVERTMKYTDVEVIVYASDRDKTNTGWGGIVPGVVDGRVPFVLSEGINPAKIHGQLRFKADVIVTERFNAAKKIYKAKQVEITRTNI